GKIPTAPDQFALMIITISIITKELLFRYKMRIGKKYDSTALISDAWHHRSDALSSLAVLIGVGLAILGETFNVGLLIYGDRKSTRLNSSHVSISYAVFCLKKKKKINNLVNYTDRGKYQDDGIMRLWAHRQ